MSDDITIQEVDSECTVPLRHARLRPAEPIEHCRYPEDGAPETFHVAAIEGGAPQCVVSMYREPLPERAWGVTHAGAVPAWRFRGMATAPGRDGQGLGRRVLAFAIERAWETHRDPIWCNARGTAVSFYEQRGFAGASAPFDLPGIGDHLVMTQWPDDDAVVPRALDLEYARFNALKTVSDRRASRFQTRAVGPITVTTDAVRDDAYYHRGVGLTAAGVPWLEDVLAREDAPLRFDVNVADDHAARALAARGWRETQRVAWLTAPAGAGDPAHEVRQLHADDRALVRWFLEQEGGAIDEVIWRVRAPLLATETFRLFVVELDGAPAGIASSYRGRHGVILGNAYTVPAARGRGVQRALLAARRRDAAQLGASEVWCDTEVGSVSERNAVRAGFTPRGVLASWVAP